MEFKDTVAVVVLTYFSEKTIEETLESIKNQTYNKKLIELIISDDCSMDGTNEVISNWLKKNKYLFYSVNFLRHKENMGIVGNLNNALREVNSEWVKIIAGDDLLIRDCIELFVREKNISNGDVYFSLMQTFKIKNNEIVKMHIYPPRYQREVLKANYYIQKEFLKKSSFSAAPTSFIKMSLLKNIGFLDTQYLLMEDYPLWIKIINYGVKFHFLENVTVLYRVGESVSRSQVNIINTKFLDDIIKHEKVILNLYNKNDINYYRKKTWLKMYPKIVLLFKNKRSILSRGIILLTNVLFKVGYLQAKLKR